MINTQTQVQPHHYQFPVIQSVKKALEIRDKILFIMASGLGKTITSAFVVRDMLWQGKRGLFLCHENDILSQAEQEYRRIVGDQIVYKTFYGQTTKDWTADMAHMLFASFQSLNNWHEKWYMAFEPDHFDFMVVDEGHHGQAPSYKEVIDYFTCKKIGMTATPDREDKKDIREIFGEEVYTISLEEGIAKRWLSDVEYHILSDGINNKKLNQICKEVLAEGKRLSVNQLNETIFIKKRDLEEKLIISEYSQLKKYAKGKKTMIFCENIEHAENLAKYFKRVGVVHSERTDSHNLKTLADFRKGKLQYIISVDKFNEGVDVPDVEVVAFLRATDSMRIFFQQLGRGLRKTPLKKKVIILDFVANCERLVMVRDLMNRVKEIAIEANDLSLLDAEPFHVSGKGFDFSFSDEIVDVLKVIEAIKKGFYPTWQEASIAAIGLGIKSQREYYERCKEDPRLYHNLYYLYPEFPGIKKFLATEREFYPTWQEAGIVAQRLGIRSSRQYLLKYKADVKLSSSPEKEYEKDFPGWYIFLGKKLPQECTREDLINQLKEEAENLGQTPTYRQLIKASKAGRIVPHTTFVKMFGSHNKAFIAAGLIPNLEMKFRSVSKRTLIRQMKTEAKRLGKTPRGADIEKAYKEGRMASESTFNQVFGGLTKSWKAAGLKAPRVWRYNKKELIKQLKAEAKRLKNTPRKIDIEKACKKGRTASAIVFRRVFGNYSKALKAAKLKVRKRSSKKK